MPEPSYTLEPDVVDTLLKKLSTDDDFRRRFTTDWYEAVQSIGHQPPGPKPGQPPGKPPMPCQQPPRIADKDVIAQSRDKLRNTLAASLSQNIRVLDDQSPHWPK